MTADTVGAPSPAIAGRAPVRFKPLQAIAFTGLAIVFFPTLAALLNGWMGRVPFAGKLGQAATLTHFALIFAAVPLAMVQLALPKGTVNHRFVGYLWCALLMIAATVSFAMREINDGGFSPPHIFSVITLICVPLLVYFARSHRVKWHRGIVMTLVFIMIIAGVLTFLPGRAIGTMFWAMWS